MAHTKGPWEAHNGEVTTQQIDGRSFRRIAAVQDYGMGSQREVDEDNARLIAAAPELLEALRQFVDEFDGCYAEGEPAMVKARAAIAKATTTP